MEWQIDSNGRAWPKIYGWKSPPKQFVGVMKDIDDEELKKIRHWTNLRSELYEEEVKKMKIVEFYRGERGNQNGHMLDEILTWSNGALDMDHDWVQWVFASNEASMLNGEAPVMTKAESELFENDPSLQDKMEQSFLRFLSYLGFEVVIKDAVKPHIEPIESENTPWWLRSFNHNMLRVTRVLKSLRLTGHTEYAVALYNALLKFEANVSPNTWQYWKAATFDDLWFGVQGTASWNFDAIYQKITDKDEEIKLIGDDDDVAE